jgi:hypothetical protein
MCDILPVNNRALQSTISKKLASFPIHGPTLFNALPAYIRNLECDMDKIKCVLDKFLLQLPDEPYLPGYPYAGGNSILLHLSRLRANGDYALWREALPQPTNVGRGLAATHRGQLRIE